MAAAAAAEDSGLAEAPALADVAADELASAAAELAGAAAEVDGAADAAEGLAGAAAALDGAAAGALDAGGAAEPPQAAVISRAAAATQLPTIRTLFTRTIDLLSV